MLYNDIVFMGVVMVNYGKSNTKRSPVNGTSIPHSHSTGTSCIAE